MKPRSLLVIHASVSHIRAFTGLIESLVKYSHLMICTQSGAAPFLESYRCDKYYLDVMPFGLGFETSISLEKHRGSYRYDMILRTSDFLYRERKRGLENLLLIFKPSAVFIDILYSTDVLLFREILGIRDLKLFYISSKASLNRSANNPPICTGVKPKNHLHVDQLWKKYNRRVKFKSLLMSIRYLTFTNEQLLRDHINPPNRLSDIVIKDFVGTKVKNVPELIFVPPEFELQPVEKSRSRFYVGFQFRGSNEYQNYESTQNKRYFDELKCEFSAIIYCAFGSLYMPFVRSIKRFLHRLFRIFENRPEYCLIISYSKTIVDEICNRHTIPFNVRFIQNIDQYEALRYSDLFITHGGINSIKESIYAGTPMLVYPLNLNWDQPGNAVRIEALGLGCSGNIRRDTIPQITDKIESLLHSKDIQAKLSKFMNLDKKYGSDYLDNHLLNLMDSDIETSSYFDR